MRPAISPRASSQVTVANLPEPLGPVRFSGARIRSAVWTCSGKYPALRQMKPRVTGWSGSPLTAVILPASTLTSKPQVSGQSLVHTERFHMATLPIHFSQCFTRSRINKTMRGPHHLHRPPLPAFSTASQGLFCLLCVRCFPTLKNTRVRPFFNHGIHGKIESIVPCDPCFPWVPTFKKPRHSLPLNAGPLEAVDQVKSRSVTRREYQPPS